MSLVVCSFRFAYWTAWRIVEALGVRPTDPLRRGPLKLPARWILTCQARPTPEIQEKIFARNMPSMK